MTDRVFNNCTSLTSIALYSNTTIGHDAFSNCRVLSDIYLYNNNLDAVFPKTSQKHLTINDNAQINLDASIANTFVNIAYNRELPQGKYGTIMLPFAPDEESLGNFVFFELTAANNEGLTFDEVEAPQANTPYLYRLREGKFATQITGGETTISSVVVTPEIDGWQTIGSFTNHTVECSDASYYAINAEDNMLYNVISKLNVKPYRAYFKSATTNAPMLIVRTRGGEETRIDATEVEDLAPAVYYDLNGRRVENPEKGIYIVNGRKVIL